MLYAIPMILGELKRHLRDNGAIRVSRSMRDTAYHAMKAKEELTVRQGREPTVEEIGISQAQVSRIEKGAIDSIKREL